MIYIGNHISISKGYAATVFAEDLSTMERLPGQFFNFYPGDTQ